MSANNETGVCQPMREIGEICAKPRRSFSHRCDPKRGQGRADLAEWQVGALSVAAHKFHGPLGAGLLWLKNGVPIARLMEGGSHENERRPGTENTAAIAGLAEAARLYGSVDPVEAGASSTTLDGTLWQELESLGGVRRNGDPESACRTRSTSVSRDCTARTCSSARSRRARGLERLGLPGRLRPAVACSRRDGRSGGVGAATVRFSIGRRFATRTCRKSRADPAGGDSSARVARLDADQMVGGKSRGEVPV
jgi:hypothetical protein